MPDLRLAPEDQALEFDPDISFRGPKELWVEHVNPNTGEVFVKPRERVRAARPEEIP